MVDQTASLERVTAIAVEHHTALDQATRLAHAIAWTGGGASAFAELLTEQRAALQMALAESISLFSGTPELATDIPPARRPSGTFAGFSRDVLPTLAGELCAAARDLVDIAGFLGDELSAAGKSDRPARVIADIGFWSGEQAGHLRDRLVRLPRARSCPPRWPPTGCSATTRPTTRAPTPARPGLGRRSGRRRHPAGPPAPLRRPRPRGPG